MLLPRMSYQSPVRVTNASALRGRQSLQSAPERVTHKDCRKLDHKFLQSTRVIECITCLRIPYYSQQSGSGTVLFIRLLGSVTVAWPSSSIRALFCEGNF